jgi:hypothetical protein
MTSDYDGDLITPEQGIAARDLLKQTPGDRSQTRHFP